MPVTGKMPPLVTELDGDLSGLAHAFEEGTALAEVYADDMDRILSDGFRQAGDSSGREFRDASQDHFDSLFDDIEKHFSVIEDRSFEFGDRSGGSFSDGFEEEVKRRSPRMGRAAGGGFLSGFSDIGESFQRMMIPLLIGAVILASPAIGALIASAVTVGLGLGFAGLGTIIAVTMLPKIAKEFQKLGAPLRAAFKYSVTGAFDDALKGVPRILRAFIPAFGRGLREIFDAVAPLIRPLALNIGKAVTEILGGIGTSLDQAAPAIQTWISTIPQVAQAFSDMLIRITSDPDALSRFISDAANTVVYLVTGLGDLIYYLTEIYDWSVKINDKFPFIGWTTQIEGAKIAWEGVSTWVKDKWNALGSWFSQRSSDVGKWFSSIPGKVREIFAKIPGFLNELWHKIIFGIGWLAGRMVADFLALPGRIGAALKFLWSALWGYFTAVIKLVGGLAYKAVMAVVDWFKKLPGRAQQGFVDFKNAVFKFFRDSPSWLYNAGKDIVRGVINGIRDMGSWAIGKVKDFGGSLIKGFKEGIGSHSPSTKFADAAFSIPQGIVVGIGRGHDMVQRAVRRIVPVPSSAAVSGAMGVRYNASGGGSGGSVVLDNTIYLDGTAVARGLSAPAQRRANQSGTTGLGTRPRTGFGT